MFKVCIREFLYELPLSKMRVVRSMERIHFWNKCAELYLFLVVIASLLP